MIDLNKKPFPIADPEFWRLRVKEAQEKWAEEHRALFNCCLAKWREIEEVHQGIIEQHIKVGESVLDCGCGWGRLLELLSGEWGKSGEAYCGVDISPDFISLARASYPSRRFEVCDLRDLTLISDPCNPRLLSDRWDWAICISIRPMVYRNLGREAWETMEREISRVARRVLFLEYDVEDPGEILESQLL